MRDTAIKLLLYRQSIRQKVFRELARRLHILSYEERIEYSAIDRPHYAYCVLQAAKLAAKLGHRKVSVIEFGVAGGNGLLNLEMHAVEAKKITGVDVQIFGFDTGRGLPPPTDYRDLPYHWKAGFFAMNVSKLQAQLKTAQLVIGDVADTVASFAEKYSPAPIGALLMDLDYYSSTKHALTLLDLNRSALLPRTFMYFDDIIGDDIALYNEYTGVRLAINEFNAGHAQQKIGDLPHLWMMPGAETWRHQIYVCHDFSHPDYCKFVSDEQQQLPLRSSSRVEG
jgi:hypothetical protein